MYLNNPPHFLIALSSRDIDVFLHLLVVVAYLHGVLQVHLQKSKQNANVCCHDYDREVERQVQTHLAGYR